MNNDINKTRQTLLEKLRNKYDEKSWNEFVKTYKSYICIIIKRMGINEADTEDLSQQVMLKLWKKIPEFEYRRDKRFRHYIATTTRNTVHDFIRKSCSEKARIDSSSISSDKVSSLPDIDCLIKEEWESFIANLALDNIRKNFEISSIDLFLQILDGKTPQALASELDLKVNSVQRTFKRIKDKLKEEISRLKVDLD